MMLKRGTDIILALALAILLAIPSLIIAIVIRTTSRGSAIHWSRRIGQNNREFLMPKFRTMYTNTPQVATHLMKDTHCITPVGSFLRKTSLDEIPQLWSVIKGDMSFVGPRPALYNQFDLIKLRTDSGIEKLLPGITGWAQINGRDELSIEEKVKYEEDYQRRKGLFFDLQIIIRTVKAATSKADISH